MIQTKFPDLYFKFKNSPPFLLLPSSTVFMRCQLNRRKNSPPVSLFSTTTSIESTKHFQLVEALSQLANTELTNSNTKIHIHLYSLAFQSLTGTPSLVKQGKQLHGHMTLHGFYPNSSLGARIVAMYASFGDLTSAVSIFNQIILPRTLPFNALIRGYSILGYSFKTLEAYSKMHRLGVYPNQFTLPFVLNACTDLYLISIGKCIHRHCLRIGIDCDLYVGTSLIDMYVKCGEMEDARRVFDVMPVKDVSSWNALIAGYFKYGNVEEAVNLFDVMPERNVVSWTAMISGFAQNGLADQALGVFDLMRVLGIKPNWITLVSVLPACGHSAALEQGLQIHDYARTIGLASHISVQSALVGMYGKCGSLAHARCVFDSMKKKDLDAWNTMISEYASHGFAEETITTFEDMRRAGTSPDEITFIGLLSACGHAGLVDQGCKLFKCMKEEHGVEPKEQHYACMVDLLSRAGCLHEARDLVRSMNGVDPGPTIWGALLAASRVHQNLVIGEEAARKLFVLEPKNSGNYVLLANMYARLGRWRDVNIPREILREHGLNKSPGCSCIWSRKNETGNGYLSCEELKDM